MIQYDYSVFEALSMGSSTVLRGKRRDSKKQILRNGESQRKDGWYVYKQTNAKDSPSCLQAYFLFKFDKPSKIKKNSCFKELEIHEENLIHLPRQYLPQPHGGVCDEGAGEEGRRGAIV